MTFTRRRRQLSLDAFFQIPAVQDTSDENNQAELERLKRALRLAIQKALTERQRECLTLYYFEGCSMKQAADRLGIGEPTVSKHLKKARARLKAVLRYSLASPRLS